jgi:hypothetical protein
MDIKEVLTAEVSFTTGVRLPNDFVDIGILGAQAAEYL